MKLGRIRCVLRGETHETKGLMPTSVFPSTWGVPAVIQNMWQSHQAGI